MSHEGRMHRGAKWLRIRDDKGELSQEVKDMPGAMADVNYYLENTKKEEKPKSKEKK